MKETYITNYWEKLENFQEYVRETSSKNCIEVFQSQVEEARLQLSGKINDSGEDLGDVFIRTLSKDLSRYHDSYSRYQNTLEEMNSENLKYLRSRIILQGKDFFEEIWGEDSGNFFRTRKFISIWLKDLSLASKLGASLDCIVTSLYRYLYSKYDLSNSSSRSK